MPISSLAIPVLPILWRISRGDAGLPARAIFAAAAHAVMIPALPLLPETRGRPVHAIPQAAE